MDNLLARFANAFPLWVFACSALALWQPALFTWFSGPWITYGLGIIMLGMGITLTTLSTIMAVIVIALIVASVLGSWREQVLAAGSRLLLGVFLLNICGFGFGYLLSKLWNRSETVARTVSIEVGMQNSGLGAHLARGDMAQDRA